jgi:ribosomal protein S18 acetylase RimI-like enzyme
MTASNIFATILLRKNVIQNTGVDMRIRYYILFLFVHVFAGAQDSQFSIEPFQEHRDAEAVKKIIFDHYNTLNYEAKGYAEGTTERYLTSSNYTTKVLRVEDTTVGFINYAPIKFGFFLRFFFNDAGIINLMGVDSNYQSRGYGRELLHHALEDLRSQDMHKAQLFTHLYNTKARQLYEKEGFRFVLGNDKFCLYEITF